MVTIYTWVGLWAENSARWYDADEVKNEEKKVLYLM